jgi:AraC-like DNA-binding protein
MEDKLTYPKNSVFVKYIYNTLPLNFQVMDIGYEKCAKNKNEIFRKDRGFWTIHFVVDGKGTLKLNGKEFNVKKNEVFILPATGELSYKPDPTFPWQYFWFEISGTEIKDLLASANIDSLNPVGSFKDEKTFEACIKEFLTILNSKFTKFNEQLNALSIVLKIFSILIGNVKKESIGVKKNNLITPIIDYINNNFTNADLSLSYIANKFYVNASYLSRLFAANVGTSLSKYIIQLRMHKSVSLLLSDEYSISEIAIIVGYNDPLYFSTEFKKFFALSPLKYKKEVFKTIT